MKTRDQILVDLKYQLFIALTVFIYGVVYATTDETANIDEEQDVSVVTSYKLSFVVQSLGDLTEMIGIEVPPSGPVSFSGDLAFTLEGFILDDIKIQIGQSDISGHMSADLNGQRPSLTAEFKSSLINLTEYYTEDKQQNLAGDNQDGQNERQDKLFSRDSLSFEAISNIDINLGYSADRIITNEFTINELQMVLKNQDGILTLDPFTALMAGGRLNASANLNSNQPVPEMIIDVRLDRLEPERLTRLQKDNAVTGMLTDFEFRATGHGNNVADIMGSLSGHFLARTGEGQIKGRHMDKLAGDIFFDTINMLNPLRKQTTETAVVCSVIKFDIKDGVAQSDKGIALQTKYINVLGSGAIDLKTESMDFAIHPEPRKGIDLKIGNLAEFLQITGTLTKPKVRPSTIAALKTATRATAAIFSAGLSILAEGLINKALATDDPCGMALGKTKANGGTEDLLKDSLEGLKKLVPDKKE